MAVEHRLAVFDPLGKPPRRHRLPALGLGELLAAVTISFSRSARSRSLRDWMDMLGILAALAFVAALC
ncbi:hypothetical protein GCM10027612_65920 [Microbispora bryophytorum subsp. camponoti]